MAVDPSLSPVEARRLRFLFWAYAAIWTLLAAYLVSLGLRLRAVRAELGRVRARLEAAGPRSGAR
jgi:CcmD family protein